MKKNYFRQFVTLLQERPGHTMPGKQAVGRIVIEARDEMARATVYIQDLSPQNSYKLAFISKAGEANLGVVLGSIIVDERGRYEGKFEFSRADIGGSRITCEGIDACVVLLNGGEEDYAAPLAGYRLAPFSWRVNLSFPDGKEDSPILEVKQVEEEKIEKVVEIEEKVEVEEIPKIEAVEEASKVKEVGVEAEEVPPPAYDFVTEVTQNSQSNDRFSALFESESIIEIFGNSDRFPSAQWIVTTLQKIEGPGEVQAMGQIVDDILKNSLVRDCCDKHRHILLGRNADGADNIYILGVPDVFDITIHTNEHEFNSIFDSFKLCSPSDPARGAHGYWLKQL